MPGDDVGVGVEGHLDGGVAEHLLDELGVRPTLERKGGRRVATSWSRITGTAALRQASRKLS